MFANYLMVGAIWTLMVIYQNKEYFIEDWDDYDMIAIPLAAIVSVPLWPLSLYNHIYPD